LTQKEFWGFLTRREFLGRGGLNLTYLNGGRTKFSPNEEGDEEEKEKVSFPP